MPTAGAASPRRRYSTIAFAIDGVADRLPHAHVLQDRIAHVEADVLVVQPGRLRPSAGCGSRPSWSTMSGARSLTTMSIVPLRSSRPRMMSSGTTLKMMPSFCGAPAVVVVERRQLELIVDGVPDEPVRPGADRVLAKGRPGAVRHDRRHHEVDRKRSERLLQREHDRVAIARVDRLQHPISALARRDERRSSRLRNV